MELDFLSLSENTPYSLNNQFLDALTVFARSNTGIVASNPTQGMDVCFYSVFV
jgi:hypothetical protein